MNSETPIEAPQGDQRPSHPAVHRNRRHHFRRRPRRSGHDPARSNVTAEQRDGHSAVVEKTDGRAEQVNARNKPAPSAPPPRPQSPHVKAEITALSVVIPLFNEAASLAELHAKITEVINRIRLRAEIIFVDDGSTDGSFEKLQQLQRRDRRVRVIQFRRNYGKAAALAAGFSAAQGSYIVTMDADLQDDPEEIPHLLEELKKGYDLISGWKKRRHDKFSKRSASKIFNTVTGFFTGVKLHDINCGLKAYRREVTDNIRVYGQLHRFLPVLAHKEGFRIGEVEVKHHPRKHGKSKFGLSRYTSGLFDLVTVLFLTRYTRRPLHLFGLGGLIAFALGFGINAYLTYERLFNNRYLSNRPLLFLGLLLLIIGVQMISFGLLGEMLAATQNQTPNYGIKAELGFEKR
jgi:glycosyltransferase involved in cell wall biosynthesis